MIPVEQLGTSVLEYASNRVISDYEEDLTYGIHLNKLDLRTGQRRIITLYLHQQYVNLLVVLDPPAFKVLDLQRCRIEKIVPRLEIEFNLKYYLQVRDGTDSVVFTFESIEQRNETYINMGRLIEKFRHYFPEIDSNTMRLFLEADVTYNGKLSMNELSTIMRRLKITPNQNTNKLLHFSRKGIIDQDGELNIRQFETFSKLLCCRMELRGLFQKYVKIKLDEYKKLTQGLMTKEQFKEFLRVEQKIQSAQERQHITEKVFTSLGERLSFYHFCVHLFSGDNSLMCSTTQQREFDEDQPLHHYYCLSSHNTYLSGNQLTSTSKVQRYVEDLEEGVRCVELDIHDDGAIPIIKHGYTATEPILFEDVVKAIALYCQTYPQHTPIILSLENHCGSDNMDRVAHILMKYFSHKQLIGGKILMVKGDSYPTLRQLRGKIIIKGTGKHKDIVRMNSANKDIIQQASEDQHENEENQKNQNAIPRRLPLPFAKKKTNFLNKTLQLAKKKKQSKKALSYINGLKIKPKDKLPQLLSITSMLSSGRIGEANCWESVSLSEGKILSMLQTKQILHRQTSGSWVRVYPSGARISSSNYNPLPMLEVGAQLVALNTQSKSIETSILYSFFLGNKNQMGYLLKPQFLRNTQAKRELLSPKTIKIKVISCHGITPNQPSLEIPPVKVNIGLFASEVDSKSNPNSGSLFPFTETIEGNSYNPVFKQARQFCCTIIDPFFAMICFEIPECGQTAIPVRLMRQGYRVVSLLHNTIRESGSYILVHVDIN